MTYADSPKNPTSFLVADCGNTQTSAVLFDVVEGAYRFVAASSGPTTLIAPWSNLMVGVQRAAKHLSRMTGRGLLDDQGILIKPVQANGIGVDHFAATISAGSPLRCILVGLLDEVSLGSARHALNNIYAHEVDHLSLADTRGQQEQIAAITRHRPELILISGGTDGGASDRVMKLVETVALGIHMLNGNPRPHVIYAGNAALRERVTELLGGISTLHVAENVRPQLEVERLDDVGRVINDIYQAVKIDALPGSIELTRWGGRTPVPTARAFAAMVEYFAALYEGGVLGVDLGSHSVTLAAAEPQNMRLMIRSDLGMGRPVSRLLDGHDPGRIGRWLPGDVDPSTLVDAIYDKSLHPQTVPVTEEELNLEQALAREVLRQVVAELPESWHSSASNQLPPFRMLLVRGSSLANTPRPGQAVLMLLDALQPVGTFSIALDRHGVLPSLGALAGEHPLLVVQALEGGVLVDLGWVVAPTGRFRSDRKVLTVHMEAENGSKLEVEVMPGTLEVLPLAAGQSAELRLTPARGIDIGYGPGQGKKLRIQGGTIGLIVDARGRPVALPDTAEERQEKWQQWLWDMGG